MIELTFASDVNEVEAVCWMDGTSGKLTLKDKKVSLAISGGTGVLIKSI